MFLVLLKRRRRKNDRAVQTSSEPIAEPPDNPNDISMYDAETQSGNGHEPNENINDDVHDDAQPSNDNDVEIEPTVDLDNPQSKNQCYNKKDLLLGNMVRKENLGFRNPCPFLRNHPGKKMMSILSALLK